MYNFNREYNFNIEEYMNRETVTIEGLIGGHLMSRKHMKSRHFTLSMELSIQVMNAIQQNKVLKHLVFEDLAMDKYNVNAIISIIKEKNLVSCKIGIRRCDHKALRLIAACAVEFYRTKFTFYGDMVGTYTELDLEKALNKECLSNYYITGGGGINSSGCIRQTLLEAMAKNNYLNSLHNSWQETKLLWLASKYDKNSMLQHHNQTEIPAEIIHNVARQSFLNKLG